MEKTINNKPQTNAEQAQSDNVKSAAIMHAIEIDSNFKLYAHRIISHEQFITRTQELIQFFNQTVKNG